MPLIKNLRVVEVWQRFAGKWAISSGGLTDVHPGVICSRLFSSTRGRGCAEESTRAPQRCTVRYGKRVT